MSETDTSQESALELDFSSETSSAQRSSDNLTGGGDQSIPRPNRRLSAVGEYQDLLLQVLSEAPTGREAVTAAQLSLHMREKDPNFTPIRAGFKTFGKFLDYLERDGVIKTRSGRADREILLNENSAALGDTKDRGKRQPAKRIHGLSDGDEELRDLVASAVKRMSRSELLQLSIPLRYFYE